MTRKARPLIVLASVAAALAVCGYALLELSNSRSFQVFGTLVDRVPTQQKMVALTFDDAPSPQVDAVLGLLNAQGAKATFFAIGRAIEEYPRQAQAIANAGMEIGNHSYSHQRLLFQSQAFIDSEIQKTNRLIRGTGYEGAITFRPPYGKKLFGLPWYLAQHGIATVMWDVEPDTYVTLPEGDAKTEALVDYAMRQVRPGSIILLHPFCGACASDRQAIGRIIDGLETQGYRLATVSELLSARD